MSIDLLCVSLFFISVSEKLGFLSYKAEYMPDRDTCDDYHCMWICTKYISKEYITKDITLKSVSRESFEQLKSKLRDFQNCKNIVETFQFEYWK